MEISSNKDAKIVSIAQDLIYAESKGWKQTHKSLALGMTVRQITGYIRLLRILHGLVHTSSAATVYRHDTALAIVNSDSAGKEMTIPRNASANTFTTIVWDNNDFNKETVSGKGTTHVTNRIVEQNEVVKPTLRAKKPVSKKNHTIPAPEANILPYTSREKGTILLKDESCNISLDKESYCLEQTIGKIVDFVYSKNMHLRVEKICLDGLDLIPKHMRKFQIL